MFLHRIKILSWLLVAVAFTACNEYQKVLKSTDTEYKLEKGLQYYDQGKYAKAFPIFDELLTLYRGTAKAQDVYYYYAMTQYRMGDNLLAAYHFKTFYQTFPHHEFADESAFMVGYCYALESPKYSLDQANTYKAINELQLYINTHPNSSHITECNQIIDEMRDKLERKSFEIAKQYWHTENYKAAVESLSGTLYDFPDTKYREEAMFLKLDASYKLAMNSIVSLQPLRLKEARTAYFDFIEKYPESKHRKSADKLYDQVNEQIALMNAQKNELNNANNNS